MAALGAGRGARLAAGWVETGALGTGRVARRWGWAATTAALLTCQWAGRVCWVAEEMAKVGCALPLTREALAAMLAAPSTAAREGAPARATTRALAAGWAG